MMSPFVSKAKALCVMSALRFVKNLFEVRGLSLLYKTQLYNFIHRLGAVELPAYTQLISLDGMLQVTERHCLSCKEKN